MRGETYREHATAASTQGACCGSLESRAPLGITACLLIFHLTDLTFQGRELPQSTAPLYLGPVSKRGNVVRSCRNTEDKVLMAVDERKRLLMLT